MNGMSYSHKGVRPPKNRCTEKFAEDISPILFIAVL